MTIGDYLGGFENTDSPAVCWNMWKTTPNLCDILTAAAAFIYAAERGWILSGPLPGEAIPGDTLDGIEKLAARRLFLDIIRRTPTRAERGHDSLFQAMDAAPVRWQEFGMTTRFVHKLAWTAERAATYPKLVQIKAEAI
jgi:hypothetical protein